MKKYIYFLIFSCTLILIFIYTAWFDNDAKTGFKVVIPQKLSKSERLTFYHQYEIERTKDPRTGKVPQGIRAKVLQFASSIPSSEDLLINPKLKAKYADYEPGYYDWQNVGPNNIGGRMNCIDVDIENPNIILSGAASGGLWRSIDAGISWTKTNAPNEIQSVYSLAQDRRPDKSNIWYYGTGELLSTVDRRLLTVARMSYPGNGIYKSTDNGTSWFPLKSTQSKTVGNLQEHFQGVWRIIPDHTDLKNDIVFAACLGGIMKSTDGGTSWKLVLGDKDNKSLASDLQMTTDGVLYAAVGRITISGNVPVNSGIFRSFDKGSTWIDITPEGFQINSKVIKLALAPSTDNTIYALVDYPNQTSYDPYAFTNSSLALWKAQNLSGSPIWSNKTSSIFPPTQEIMNPHTLGGYAMVIKVSPLDEDFVLFGGTSMYRSTNGFDDNSAYSMIGGYYWDDGSYGYDLSSEYLHPDIHDFVFLPDNPSAMIVAGDGGVHYTENIKKIQPDWYQKNVGLVTSQFYSIAMGHSAEGRKFLAGGLQDNGSFCYSDRMFNKKWEQVTGADGMQAEVAGDLSFLITSWQSGSLIYAAMEPDTKELIWAKYASNFDNPSGAYNFFTLYILDHNTDNAIYQAAKNKVIFNQRLNLIRKEDNSYQNEWNTTPPNAFVFPLNENLTAMKISKSLPDVLFVGTSLGKVYMINNINKPNLSSRVEITGEDFPEGGWVSCIEYDELNQKIIVSFSNYNVLSIFASDDDGISWQSVGGNLEENPDGTGTGPSVRWIETVYPEPGKAVYLVGTDIGLFSANSLINETLWLHEGKSTIGNVIVENIDSYEGNVVVATQGAGIFYSSLPNSNSSIPAVSNALYQNFPNPFSNNTTIEFALLNPQNVSIKLFDINGRKIADLLNGFVEAGSHKLHFNPFNLPSGIYFYTLFTNEGNISRKMILKK